MSEETSEEQIKAMIGKARDAEKSDDALKWSQAACNAANAVRVLSAQ